MEDYPGVQKILDGFNSTVRNFIVDQATLGTESSLLATLLGPTEGRALRLTFFVDGIHIALAESDEFITPQLSSDTFEAH
jgi:hypothetical protein